MLPRMRENALGLLSLARPPRIHAGHYSGTSRIVLPQDHGSTASRSNISTLRDHVEQIYDIRLLSRRHLHLARARSPGAVPSFPLLSQHLLTPQKHRSPAYSYAQRPQIL